MQFFVDKALECINGHFTVLQGQEFTVFQKLVEGRPKNMLVHKGGQKSVHIVYGCHFSQIAKKNNIYMVETKTA